MLMKALAFLVTLVAILAGLWFFFQPSEMGTDPASAGKSPVSSPAFEFRVVQGAVSGPETMVVKQGQDVRIVVQADAIDEIHLHGYELTAHLSPDIPEILEFTAQQAGRFELELHNQHLQLGILEVHPR